MYKLPTPTRRALMLAAPGLAATAAAALADAGRGYVHSASPEFRAYRERLASFRAIFGDNPHSDPGLQEEFLGSEAWEALETERTEAMWEAIEILLARKAETLSDVIELGLIVSDQLWSETADGFESHSVDGRLEPAFMNAFISLSRGEIHV